MHPSHARPRSRTQALLAFALSMWAAASTALMCGCVAVPCGEEFQCRQEINAKPVRESNLTAARIAPRLLEGKHALEVQVVGDYREHYHREVEYDEVLRRKMVVIGFFPGVGSCWWAGEPTRASALPSSYVTDVLLTVPLGVPTLNLVLLGAPTWFTWFSELARAWEPFHGLVPRNGRLTRAGLVDLSLLGWAKTSKQVRRRHKDPRDGEKGWTAQRGVPDVAITCACEAPKFELRGQTDAQGQTLLGLPPELASHVGDVLLVIGTPGLKAACEELSVVIPAAARSRINKMRRIEQLLGEAHRLQPGGTEPERLRQRLGELRNRLDKREEP